ncbi:MAG: hypothetical protein AAF318_01420 [Pseudomonadota bacterium]
MLLLALGQPAFVSGRIGPGLFAQVFAGGVVALSALWAALAVVRPAPARGRLGASLLPGLCLLGAVVGFIVFRPLIGLVPTTALMALLASVGAGERGAVRLALSAGVGAAVGFAIGLLLLPPSTALWPWSPHL